MLDIRIPMGVMFTVIGLILSGYGLVPNAELYARHSLSINMNLWWGLVLLAFGLAMLWLARRARAKTVSGTVFGEAVSGQKKPSPENGS
jgi:hypothetical protein